MPATADFHALGIATSYHDLTGQEHHADEKTLAQIAAWLSVPEEQRAVVGYEHEPLTVNTHTADEVLFDLYAEDGSLQQSALQSQQGSLELTLPLGYYHLLPRHDKTTKAAQSALPIFIVIAPQKAYQPPKGKHTGLTAQLYALRSKNQAGIGDYGDLLALCQQAKRLGLAFVGINPLHALFTHNPKHNSPYSPNSRLFLNPIYLNLDWIASDLGVENPLKPEDLAVLNTDSFVNYEKVWKSKQSALWHLFEQYWQHHDAEEFSQFVQKRGKILLQFAIFEALCEHFGNPDWQTWEQDFQNPDSEKIRAFYAQNTPKIIFHQWLQFHGEQQLKRVQQSALTLGLYGDLAVGAARGSFDTWHQQSAYCLQASMGAPPDHLAPQGQNWQLPPFHPKALIHQSFAPFIDLIRTNMRYFGMLRIDHVIGLSRLWWVAFGKDATYGAYVRYPQDILFAIIALESVRAQCVVIGEDLGIVPEETRQLLHRYGIFSYNVLYFSKQHQGFTPAEHHPTHAITVTSTHDVAPLLGYWYAHDLKQLHALEVLSTQAYQSALKEREAEKALWLKTLALSSQANLADDELLQAFTTFGASSQSALYAIQMENLLGVKENANIPGVAEGYPNWSLRYPRGLEDNEEHILHVTIAQRTKPQQPTTPPIETADIQALKALWYAELHDPFAYLGRHQSDGDYDVVRVFAPHRQRLTLCQADGTPITKAYPVAEQGMSGLFLAYLPPEIEHYRLRFDDDPTLYQDPYALPSTLSTLDLWLLGEGNHQRPYRILGAHPMVWADHQWVTMIGAGHDELAWSAVGGVRFCVWAPNATRVSVVGDFNAWDGRRHPMRFHAQAGIWEIFIPQNLQSALYKFEIRTASGEVFLKSDPYAFESELRPNTASVVRGLPKPYRAPESRAEKNALDAPISIYEVHLGSWQRHDDGTWLSYRELADKLIPYAKHMGFTHLELLPLSEFPFDGSWGYQPTSLYAPTKRFGTAEDLQYFVQQAHQQGLGVILDWVVGHFPTDAHGLARFDGSALYEHQDPREGYHQDWNTLIYNFGRHEVKNFLAGNALYWLEHFGFDGLRVDAVASMIYRDYSRKDGEWIANEYGGRENLEAIAFLRETNALIRQEMPQAIMMAEESTSFPHVTHEQGLNFHYKWNMGWMNDTLRYLKEDPINRKYHHQALTFGMMYQYSEHFVLPLSHDEVVHGKGSMIGKMQGDCWQQFANLRAYYGFMFAYAGKKLLFMGNEFAQGLEWNEESALSWHLLDEEGGWHQTMQTYLRTLNHLYQQYPAFYQLDSNPQGFEWRVVDDGNHSVYAFERYDRDGNALLAVSHFTPVVREDYRVPVKQAGRYQLLFNSDQSAFHGSDVLVPSYLETQNDEHGKPYLAFTLPPLSTVYLYQSALHRASKTPSLPKAAPKVRQKKGKK